MAWAPAGPRLDLDPTTRQVRYDDMVFVAST